MSTKKDLATPITIPMIDAIRAARSIQLPKHRWYFTLGVGIKCSSFSNNNVSTMLFYIRFNAIIQYLCSEWMDLRTHSQQVFFLFFLKRTFFEFQLRMSNILKSLRYSEIDNIQMFWCCTLVLFFGKDKIKLISMKRKIAHLCRKSFCVTHRSTEWWRWKKFSQGMAMI